MSRPPINTHPHLAIILLALPLPGCSDSLLQDLAHETSCDARSTDSGCATSTDESTSVADPESSGIGEVTGATWSPTADTDSTETGGPVDASPPVIERVELRVDNRELVEDQNEADRTVWVADEVEVTVWMEEAAPDLTVTMNLPPGIQGTPLVRDERKYTGKIPIPAGTPTGDYEVKFVASNTADDDAHAVRSFRVVLPGTGVWDWVDSTLPPGSIAALAVNHAGQVHTIGTEYTTEGTPDTSLLVQKRDTDGKLSGPEHKSIYKREGAVGVDVAVRPTGELYVLANYKDNTGWVLLMWAGEGLDVVQGESGAEASGLAVNEEGHVVVVGEMDGQLRLWFRLATGKVRGWFWDHHTPAEPDALFVETPGDVLFAGDRILVTGTIKAENHTPKLSYLFLNEWSYTDAWSGVDSESLTPARSYVDSGTPDGSECVLDGGCGCGQKLADIKAPINDAEDDSPCVKGRGGNSLAIDTAGNVLVVGRRDLDDKAVPVLEVWKFNNELELLGPPWMSSKPLHAHDVAYSAAAGYYVVVSTENIGDKAALRLTRIAADGEDIYEYDEITTDSDMKYSIAVDPLGYIWFGGTTDSKAILGRLHG